MAGPSAIYSKVLMVAKRSRTGCVYLSAPDSPELRVSKFSPVFELAGRKKSRRNFVQYSDPPGSSKPHQPDSIHMEDAY